MSQKRTDPEHALWEERMIEVLDGRADGALPAALDGHLAACPECRVLFEEYRALFARLRESSEEELPAGFWDELAADIDRRLDLEAGRTAAPAPAATPVARVGPGAPASAEARRAPAVHETIDLSERARFNGGLNGVAGGLLAAGIAILLLVGVYLELPRTAGEPQAFVTPPGRRAAYPPGEPRAPASLAGQGESSPPEAGDAPEAPFDDSDAAALLALASGLAAGEDDVAAVSAADPLAALADPGAALQGLTEEEAEQLLAGLEART